jgi:hypothetical protein
VTIEKSVVMQKISKRRPLRVFDVFAPTRTKDEINGLSHDETVKWKLTGWMLRKSASTLRMYSCSHLLRPRRGFL